MSDAKLSLAVLQRISEFLADLPEEHLEDLAAGRARLTFIPDGASAPRAPSPSPKRSASKPAPEPPPEIDTVRDRLAQMQSRDEGRAYLMSLRRPELVGLSKALGLGASGSKSVLTDRIVERMIGARLNSAAIRQL